MNDKVNYYELTETPGMKASVEQLERIYQRYHFAKQFTKDAEILEVACGSGIGLSYLAEDAKSVHGVDIDLNNIAKAKEIINNDNKTQNIIIKQMDAQKLDYPDNHFDLVLLFEALYYIPNAEEFFAEAKRVLKENGKLFICTVNREWSDFHPSPYSSKYYSISELNNSLLKEFKRNEFFGGFPTNQSGFFISILKRLATKLHLIPKNLNARAKLKRFFMGKLVEIPKKLEKNIVNYSAPVKIDNISTNRDYIIIYSVSYK